LPKEIRVDLFDSYTEAKALASRTVSYLNSKGASDATYKAYFGTNSISTVTSRFSAIANENSSSRTLVVVSEMAHHLANLFPLIVSTALIPTLSAAMVSLPTPSLPPQTYALSHVEK